MPGVGAPSCAGEGLPLCETRRESIPGGSTAASLRPRVSHRGNPSPAHDGGAEVVAANVPNLPVRRFVMLPVLLLLFPLLGQAGGSGSVLDLSLEDAVLSALEHNPALQAERFGPVAAGAFEAIERAELDATLLFAEGRARRERSDRIDERLGERFDLVEERANLAAGLRRSTPWGTDLEFSVGQRFVDTERGETALHSTRVGVGLTQQLLRGRGSEVNLLRVRQAELDTLRSEYELRGFAEALVADVEAAYWDYVLADREIAIFEESLRLTEEQIEHTRERIRLGDVAETELAPLRAERALRRQELIDARSRRHVAQLELLRLVAADRSLGRITRVNPVSDPERPVIDPDPVEDHVALALQRRPELNQARMQLQRDQLEVTRTRNGLLPRLELFVTLGRSGYSDSFSGAVEELDGPSYDAELGVRLERPLGNRAPQAEHTRALAHRNQASAGLDNLARLVRHDVRTAYLELQRAAAQIEASAETRTSQEELARVESERFRAGQTTAFAVAQAQRDLLRSRIDEEAAVVAYRRALVDLYRLDGTLLERRGIEAAAAEGMPYGLTDEVVPDYRLR